MDNENYNAQFSEYAEDYGLEISERLLTRLSKRAVQLEEELDFTPDDFFEELLNIIPANKQEDGDWEDFIHDCANFIFDEKEDGGEETLTLDDE